MKTYIVILKNGTSLTLEADGILNLMDKYHDYAYSEKDILSITILK